MIPAADVKDQELAIRPERPGIDHPAVGRCRDLGARARSDGKPFFSTAVAIRGPEFLQFDAVNRNWNLSAQ